MHTDSAGVFTPEEAICLRSQTFTYRESEVLRVHMDEAVTVTLHAFSHFLLQVRKSAGSPDSHLIFVAV